MEIGSSALSLETSDWLKENFKIQNYSSAGMNEASRSFLKPYDIELNKDFDMACTQFMVLITKFIMNLTMMSRESFMSKVRICLPHI